MKKFFVGTFILFCGLMLASCGTSSSQNNNSTNGTNTGEKNDKTDSNTNISSEETNDTTDSSANISSEEKTNIEEAADADNKYLKSLYADVLKEEIPYITDDQLELSEESYDFIKNNVDLLPAKTPENIKAAKEKSEAIDIKLLNKNVQSYYSTITTFEGYVVQIGENTFDNGETASWLNVFDDNGYTHMVYMYKSTGDILEEDRVKFYGVPLGGFSMDTDDGGFANVQLFFGSHVDKL